MTGFFLRWVREPYGSHAMGLNNRMVLRTNRMQAIGPAHQAHQAQKGRKRFPRFFASSQIDSLFLACGRFRFSAAVSRL
jgi:hypothetical protein